jgi:DnaD/phage-associated family protein
MPSVRARLISSKIVDSKRLNSLPVEAELLYYRIIVNTCRDGRFWGDAGTVNSKLLWRRRYMDEQVEEWLVALETAKKKGQGLIERYEVDGELYLWLPGFVSEQSAAMAPGGSLWARERESEYPAPPGWVEPEEPPKRRRSQPAEPSPDGIGPYVKATEDAFGTPVNTPVMAELLKDIADRFSIGLFEKALTESVRQGKRKLAYAQAILQNWETEGGPRENGSPAKGSEYEDVN